MAKRGADYVEGYSGARIEQQENSTQGGDGATERKQLHPVCRCSKLAELRRAKGQNYHYRCRVGGALRHVCYWNGREEWVPYEYCIGAHSANGPVVRREDFDQHGERSDW